MTNNEKIIQHTVQSTLHQHGCLCPYAYHIKKEERHDLLGDQERKRMKCDWWDPCKGRKAVFALCLKWILVFVEAYHDR